MRKLLLGFGVSLGFVALASGVPGSVRCGKLLDVRSGRMLSDQVVVSMIPERSPGTETNATTNNATAIEPFRKLHLSLRSMVTLPG